VQGKSKLYPEDVQLHLQQLHDKHCKKYPTQNLVPWGNKKITIAIEKIIS
jgi:hypothetical protein